MPHRFQDPNQTAPSYPEAAKPTHSSGKSYEQLKQECLKKGVLFEDCDFPANESSLFYSDPHNLGIRCKVNGEVVQNSNTNQMIFKTEALVSWVSRFVTLYPGDIFLTGTPPGVGVFKKPPVFLQAGDVVECEIDQIGKICNKVV